MNSITVLSILMLQLAVKGAFSVSLTITPGFSTVEPVTTDVPQTVRPITPPPPPSPPPAPPASLFTSVNGSTVAPPTSMTPVRTTIIAPTITITSLVPNSPSSAAPSVSTVTKPSPVATTPGDGDECKKGNDCEQVCVNTPDGHECQCLEGYMLWRDKTSCQDIDECNSIYNDCPVNTKCVNSVGTYTCECIEGYKKNNDGDCVDVDECSEVSRPCPSNSVCENTEGSYICNCDDGYFQNGGSCTDIDYCEMGNDCEQICRDGTSSFTCDCYAGYTLNSDGKTCKDDGEDCSLTCINGYCVAGRFGDSCRCSPGYEMKDDNGTISCVDINECIPTTLPEIPFRKCKSLCENFDGSYKCSCFNGQIQAPDERTCIDIDECADDALNDCAPPSEGGNCTNLEGVRKYTCSCMQNYQGNGRTCEVMDTCSKIPCEGENFICENYPGGRRCLCEPGFYISEDGIACKKAEKTYATVLVMKGPQDIFTYDLEDKASDAYLELASETEQSLDYEFKKKYGSAFLKCTVESFESGSIVANVATYFNSEFKGDVADVNKFLQDEAIYCNKNICCIGTICNIDTSKSVVEGKTTFFFNFFFKFCLG
ncbi:latent-transforming growth factor beta-binding protein 1-like [Anneissia japonica]|uniref:latent-transforming growth factor beta-binding protein 1-like n=1 Tax=Anneissia japonica TaxID=1529436 RepID=UPI001425B2F9|nr:latent-transforming growth factor beta-binding protein 1-like [Anneissia japonica]